MTTESVDPLDRWIDPSQIQPLSVSGTVTFPCCGKMTTVTGDDLRQVQCSCCRTLYGITLQVALISSEEYRFAVGTPVRVLAPLDVVAGSSPVRLDPALTYSATQDVHGVLNVPPGYQPVLVPVVGDRGVRSLVALVPADRLEPAGSG